MLQLKKEYSNLSARENHSTLTFVYSRTCLALKFTGTRIISLAKLTIYVLLKFFWIEDLLNVTSNVSLTFVSILNIIIKSLSFCLFFFKQTYFSFLIIQFLRCTLRNYKRNIMDDFHTLLNWLLKPSTLL